MAVSESLPDGSLTVLGQKANIGQELFIFSGCLQNPKGCGWQATWPV
jgi:hypothetical protein